MIIVDDDVDICHLVSGGHYNPCSTNHSNDPAVADRHIGDINRLTIPAGDVLSIDVIDPQVGVASIFSI